MERNRGTPETDVGGWSQTTDITHTVGMVQYNGNHKADFSFHNSSCSAIVTWDKLYNQQPHQALCPVMRPQGSSFPPQTDRIMMGARDLIFKALPLLPLGSVPLELGRWCIFKTLFELLTLFKSLSRSCVFSYSCKSVVVVDIWLTSVRDWGKPVNQRKLKVWFEQLCANRSYKFTGTVCHTMGTNGLKQRSFPEVCKQHLVTCINGIWMEEHSFPSYLNWTELTSYCVTWGTMVME